MMAWILSAFADEAGESTDEQLKALGDAGISYIDPRGVDGHNITELPIDAAKRVAEQYEAAGVRVNMYGSPIGKIDIADDFEIDLERLRHLGEMKTIFGARAVRLFSYFNRHGADEKTWRTEALDRLHKLCDVAEELDLVLYHENERAIFGEKLAEVCVLRDEVHAKRPDRFKLIFDFDNYNTARDDVWANWLELRETTEAIHLKDSKWNPDGTRNHVPAGDGDGRIPEILKDATERGWEGPLTLEPHLAHSKAVMATGPSGEQNAQLADLGPQQCFQIAARTVKQLMSEIGKG